MRRKSFKITCPKTDYSEVSEELSHPALIRQGVGPAPGTAVRDAWELGEEVNGEEMRFNPSGVRLSSVTRLSGYTSPRGDRRYLGETSLIKHPGQ